MSPDNYFGAAVSLAKRANEMIGRDIAGRDQVHVDALLRAVAAKDPATAAAIVVDCRQQRGGGDFLVEEIRLTLSKDLKPVPASSVGMGQNSGCPRGTGRIPAVPN
jgi:ribonuclease I